MEFWEETLQAGPFVTGLLHEGLKLQVGETEELDQYEEGNSLSARQNMDFVYSEADKLLKRGCIIECNSKPRFCNPLTVAIKNGKKTASY